MRLREFTSTSFAKGSTTAKPDPRRPQQWRKWLQALITRAYNRSGPTERDLQIAWERFRAAKKRADTTHVMRRAMGNRDQH